MNQTAAKGNVPGAVSGRIDEARKIDDSLRRAGISAKRVSVCGRNIVVTTRSLNTAHEAAKIIGSAFQLVGIRESRDHAIVNQFTAHCPTTLPVWLVMARA